MQLTTRICQALSIMALLVPGISTAHSPHDVITDIAGLPTSIDSNDLYIAVTDQVFKSDRNGAGWKNLVNGLDNRYEFTSVVVSPGYERDATVFASTAGDGVYVTNDSGKTWTKANAGLDRLDIDRLSVSPEYVADGRVLAASRSGGAWRKSRGDDHWRMVLTEKTKVVTFAEHDEPNRGRWIYAGDAAGNVWRSVDNGRLWEIVYTFPKGVSITSMHVSKGTLFVGTSGEGLFRSDDEAASFQGVDGLRPSRTKECADDGLVDGSSDRHITSVVSSSDNESIFVTTWYAGVFRSADGGESWSSWSEGISCDRQADSLSVAHFGKLAETREEEGPVFWLAGFDGLFKRASHAGDWRQVETLPVGLIKGMAVTGKNDASLSIALATYGGGFYITHDLGESWTIGNKGLVTTRLTGLSFSPDYSDNGVIYAGAIRRLLRSDDRGESWEPTELRLRSFGQRVVNKLDRMGIPVDWLRSDSDGRGPIYPTVTVQPSGEPNHVVFATRSHGVMQYRIDTGEINSLWSGTDEIINSFALSPNFAADRLALASIRGSGLMRSADGGSSWRPANTGLDFVSRWRSDPPRGDFRRDVLVEFSPNFALDRTVFAGSPAASGLYRSDDQGDAWERVDSLHGLTPAPVIAIAVSPDFESDKNMMVSMKGYGLFLSRDAGQSFTRIAQALLDSNSSIEWLEYSPFFAHDRTIIAASDEKLFISGDRGMTWREVPRPVRYEDMREVVRYEGSVERARGDHYSAMTETSLSGSKSHARLEFIGAGVAWIGSRGPSFGSADVYIDGELAGRVDCNSPKPMHLQQLFVADDLEFGRHLIEIIPAHDQESTSGRVAIDAIDVLPVRRPSN